MIYKKNHVLYTIKIGKTEINSIGKSIKNITLKEKTGFVLFNLNCTPSIEHIKFCIDCMPKKGFNAVNFLKKLTGKNQVLSLEKEIELDETKNCCLIAVGKEKNKAEIKAKKLQKKFKLKEKKKLISDEKRLKNLAKKENLNKKALNGFGENFYSSLNNFYIERSALVTE